MIRRVAVLFTCAALTVAPAPVRAQDPGGQTPSVSVAPVATNREDPNAGQWFLATASPGQRVRLEARISNPASVDQVVNLSLVDLRFASDGTPTVPDVSEEVGTWGGFDEPTVTVPALGTVLAGFTVTVPAGAEPGDHVGAVLAVGQPIAAEGISVVKRVATRLYVTVPGDAQQQFVIDRVDLERSSTFVPGDVTVTVVLRNTGRVRLEPTVEVAGRAAGGASLLMTRSVEPYVVTTSLPFWGGPVRMKIEARTQTGSRAGPTKVIFASTFVMPWHLLAAAAALVLAWLGLRALWRRRGSRYDALQSDIRRIERLLSSRATAGTDGGEAVAADDPNLAIRAAIKQARRAGDHATAARLESRLEDASAEAEEPAVDAGTGVREQDGDADALDAILRELAHAPPDRRATLIAAAMAFDRSELGRRADLVAALPADVRRDLLPPKRQGTKKRTGSSKPGARKRPPSAGR